LVTPPNGHGARAFYSEALRAHPAQSQPMLHVNSVAAQSLPLTVLRVERHPHAAQCFFPLDVARYGVLVMPSTAPGAPDTTRALCFLMPGTMGVIYHPGTWHMGATVFDRDGHFTVLMWRGGPREDDEFYTIPPLTLTAQ